VSHETASRLGRRFGVSHDRELRPQRIMLSGRELIALYPTRQ
jgi:hypothetical protein